ncbi:hypothetical protein [Sphingomonas xinjiangensis]|uniref:Uncharacterized protein n=1 Tax=Sphingomonas xinjiangensis TaxID=643568 RepID=A0A840YQQ0_9SPHN|nr:hypothetical protein [Sphingomonas xinjiangensis]MBB5711421.1 hypothetical protein [Sphingomonas xinjiangensis]
MTKRDDLLSAPKALTESQVIRARQQSRARVMAVLLFAFVALVFAISLVKISQGHAP